MVRRASARTFLDAAFVLAVINPRDQHHARAMELAPRYLRKPLLTTDAVLLEVGDGLARTHKSQAAAMIGRLRAARNVLVLLTTPELFNAGLTLYTSHADKDWGLTDYLSFVVMREHGITDALTHDQHFVQAGFTALMR